MMPHRGRRAPSISIRNRKLRWSWRYNTWQITDRVTGQWRNINVYMARAYTSLGAEVDVEATEIADTDRQLRLCN